MSVNEAAERLRRFVRYADGDGEGWENEMDDALAAERRATVERIRERVIARVGAEPRDDSPSIGRAGLFAILDEEAAR